jgi:hypothetical protein
MSAELEVVPAKFEHIFDLAKSLRQDDIAEIKGGGQRPYESLRECFRKSVYKQTALVDGKVGAMWGVSGDLLGKSGRVWFLTSVESDKIHQLKFARLYAKEVASMLQLFPRLENWCLTKYSKSLRLLKLCGFTVGHPQPVGVDKEMFCPFWIGEPDG